MKHHPCEAVHTWVSALTVAQVAALEEEVRRGQDAAAKVRGLALFRCLPSVHAGVAQ